MPAGPPSVAASNARPRRGCTRRGMTLTELCVVFLILGLLATALIPSYLRSTYRARRGEALYALHAIHDFQAVNYASYGQYTTSFPALGFSLEGGTQRTDGAYQGRFYTYSLATWDLGGVTSANYRATATGDLDHDGTTLDVVIIENALTVLN